MEQFNESKVIKRVTALLNLAENGNTTEEEALAAMDKAQELMIKHAIEEAQIAQARGHLEDEKPIDKVYKLSTDPSSYQARFRLLRVIAEHNRCRVVTMATRKTQNTWKFTDSAHIIGFGNDVEYVEKMFYALVVQMWAEYTRAWKDRQKQEYFKYDFPTNQSKTEWKRSFFLGFASRIDKRLEEIETKFGAELSKALVVVERKDKLDKYEEENYNHRVKAHQNTGNGAGYKEGHKAADRADLGQTRVSTKQSLN